MSTTAQLLGTGAAGSGQPGVLAAAGAAVKAAPDAAKEFDRTVVLPAVKEFAQGVVLVAKDAQQQVGGGPRGTMHHEAYLNLISSAGGRGVLEPTTSSNSNKPPYNQLVRLEVQPCVQQLWTQELTPNPLADWVRGVPVISIA